MEKQLAEYLNTFPIPDDYTNTQCIICLDNFDLESENKFIRLPCECSNSIYHINCLNEWLDSKPDKNYCVQCKKKFEAPENLHNSITSEQLNQNNQINQVSQINQDSQHTIGELATGVMIYNQKNKIRLEYSLIKFTTHMVLNTILNLINFAYICGIKTTIQLRVLALFFLIKILYNFVSCSNISKIIIWTALILNYF